MQSNIAARKSWLRRALAETTVEAEDACNIEVVTKRQTDVLVVTTAEQYSEALRLGERKPVHIEIREHLDLTTLHEIPIATDQYLQAIHKNVKTVRVCSTHFLPNAWAHLTYETAEP